MIFFPPFRTHIYQLVKYFDAIFHKIVRRKGQVVLNILNILFQNKTLLKHVSLCISSLLSMTLATYHQLGILMPFLS